MEEESCKIFLTKPFFSSAQEDSAENYTPPNLLRRILGALKNVRIGTDLTSIQLPAQFNIPKSHLQVNGETIYGIRRENLEKCNSGKSSVERLIEVTGWAISCLQPLPFGTAPFNSILGETHHVSTGTLNVFLEQVSHHPPVSALHATDEEQNLEIVSCRNVDVKFYGTSVRLQINGKKELKLHNHGETYEIGSSSLLIKLFPLPGLEWYGTLKIQCKESGLEAEISPDRSSFLRLEANPRAVKGKIFDSASLKLLFTIQGLWDKTITVKDLGTNETKVMYNIEEVTSGLKTPIVRDPKGIWASESALVWGEVSRRILSKDWAKATQVKRGIEEKQRALLRERKSKGEVWSPKHFVVNYSKENGWDCSPIQRLVPQAPIVIP